MPIPLPIPLALTQAVPAHTGVRLMARIRNYAGVLMTQASISSINAVVTDLTKEKALAGSGFVSNTSLVVSSVVFDTLQSDLTWQKDTAMNPAPPPPVSDGAFGFNFAWLAPATNFATAGDRYQVDVKFVPVTGEPFIVPFQFQTLIVYA
jgi:hypothetical protein